MREFLAKHMQKLRFAMVGMANVVIDLGLFTLLANAVGIAAGWASIASTSVAVAFSFFGNYYYVSTVVRWSGPLLYLSDSIHGFYNIKSWVIKKSGEGTQWDVATFTITEDDLK